MRPIALLRQAPHLNSVMERVGDSCNSSLCEGKLGLGVSEGRRPVQVHIRAGVQNHVAYCANLHAHKGIQLERSLKARTYLRYTNEMVLGRSDGSRPVQVHIPADIQYFPLSCRPECTRASVICKAAF